MSPPLRLSAALWLLLTLAVSVKAVVDPTEHTTYPCFEAGTRCWWAGGNLYDFADCGHDYRYGPAFAVALTPLALLPTWLGGMMWNWLSIAVYWLAVRALVRWILPGPWSPRREAAFLGLTLLGAARMIWSAQTNTLVFALVAGAAVAVRRERWWWAALLLAMPIHLKVWPVAAALLMAACWPRQLAGRLAVALLAVGAAPFLTQPFAHVCYEYQQWYAMLTGPAQVRHIYRDAWTIWELIRTPVDARAYAFLQLAAAGAVLAVCWRRWRSSGSAAATLTTILSLWAAWQLAFGPGTERNTFGLIAPLSAWALVYAFAERRGRCLMALAFGLMLGANFGLVERSVADVLPMVLVMHPLGVLLFVVWLLNCLPRPMQTRRDSGLPAPRQETDLPADSSRPVAA